MHPKHTQKNQTDLNTKILYEGRQLCTHREKMKSTWKILY